MMIVTTDIIAGQPTSSGNIYPKAALEKAVNEFNVRAINHPSRGSELNRSDISHLGDPCFNTKKLFFNESDVLCAEIEFLDNEFGNTFKQKVEESDSIVGRPMIMIPKYKVMEQQDPERVSNTEVDKILSIVRVQLECR